MEKDKDVEEISLNNLEKENEELRQKLDGLKKHYLKVVEFACKNNIKLKQRNVPIDVNATSSMSDSV